ncbi:sortase [Candidatus Saccharibacteria bacterium]|nr:sortase [Candidatus Saccharibacteria bacterium]
MGSVEKKAIFSKKSLLLIAIFFVYFAAGFAFFYFGFKPAVSAADAYAKEAESANSRLNIPAINLDIPVTKVNMTDNNLDVPEQIVGSYSVHKNKTLLIGHSTTAFSELKNLKVGAQITYDNHIYTVTDIKQKEKADISMKEILKAEEKDTLVLMTCAGEQITKTDFSHRLIITAS